MPGLGAGVNTLVCVACQRKRCDECLDTPNCQCRRPGHRRLFSSQDVWEETEFGIRWGPLEIERMAAIDRGSRNGGYTRVVRIVAGERHQDKDLVVYVSETGRSLRVFRDGRELT